GDIGEFSGISHLSDSKAPNRQDCCDNAAENEKTRSSDAKPLFPSDRFALPLRKKIHRRRQPKVSCYHQINRAKNPEDDVAVAHSPDNETKSSYSRQRGGEPSNPMNTDPNEVELEPK